MSKVWNGFVSWYAARRKAFASLAGLALMYASQRWGATNQYVEIAIGAFAAVGVHEVSNDNAMNILGALQQDVNEIVHPQPPPPVAPVGSVASPAPYNSTPAESAEPGTNAWTATSGNVEVVNAWDSVPGGKS